VKVFLDTNVLASAGNAHLMTAELAATLCDHAVGNYRVLIRRHGR
jgi:hypothetical protein